LYNTRTEELHFKRGIPDFGSKKQKRKSLCPRCQNW